VIGRQVTSGTNGAGHNMSVCFRFQILRFGTGVIPTSAVCIAKTRRTELGAVYLEPVQWQRSAVKIGPWRLHEAN